MLLAPTKYRPDMRPCMFCMRARQLFIAVMVMLASLIFFVQPLLAQLSTGLQNDAPPVRLSLISAISATGTYNTIPLGLKAELDDGWKIYWRSPGDAGLPPVISFDDSQYAKADLQFPVPKRFSLFGIDSFGYADEVIFPLTLSGHPADTPLDIKGTAEGLVCSDICIPFSQPVEIFLPAGDAVPTIYAQPLAIAASFVPRRQTDKLSLVWRQSAQEGEPPQIALDAAVLGASIEGRVEDIFVETELSGVSFAAPVLSGDSYYMAVSGLERVSDATPLTLTVVTDTGFAEFGAEILPTSSATPQPYEAGLSLPVMLVISFLGGLILNIMPCVLPVLLLKLNSIISVQTERAGYIRIRLLTGAAGILASFFLLGAGFALLSISGRQLGWGIQFQNPVFLSVMAVVMTLFALSLFDRIILPVPGFATRRISGQSPLIQDFLSGFLATFLATPCSAPLVGTAISFAFTSPPPILLGMVMMMGVGLASPWLLGAAFPKVVSLLPRPGGWMNSLKLLMGLGLSGTVIWLVWLISLQTGSLVTLVMSAMLFGLSACLYFRQHISAVLYSPLATCFVIATIAVPIVITPDPAGRQIGAIADTAYSPFTEARLAQALASEKAVFVDVTAEWCITCKVNKKLVLESEQIVEAFTRFELELIRADWTEANPEISDFLARYNRFGIPFNILFAPDGKDYIILPEILTADSLSEALDRLANPI